MIGVSHPCDGKVKSVFEAGMVTRRVSEEPMKSSLARRVIILRGRWPFELFFWN